MFDLAGRTAAVTGPGRGIGQAISLALASAGADLVLIGRAESCQATAELVREEGGTAEVVDLDLSDIDSVEKVGRQLAVSHAIDVLVNNAGIISRGETVAVTTSEWHRVLDVNLTAPFVLTREIGASMVSRRRGKIINVASLLSFQGGVNVASYATSKHGIAGLTRALSNEWAESGVQVNALAPGYIATDNTTALRNDDSRAAEILARIPSGRWGEAADLGGAAVFLASSASDYVTGHTLVVDGGWMAR